MFRHLMVKLDDALNPIVVKELRQAVQSKFVVAVLLILLAVQMIAMGASLVLSNPARRPDSVDYGAGRDLFLMLQGILVVICLLFIPLYTAVRLAAERTDTNVDLLFISTLSPRGIIWGKFLAAIILSLMIFSACSPFMTFTYLLRGIDIPTILLVLGMDFLAVLAGTQIAIFFAAIPATRGLKVLFGLMALSSLGQLLMFTVAGTTAFVHGEGFFSKDDWQFWAAVATAAVLALAGIGLVFTWSVAIISPPTSNRALPVRLCTLGIWLGSAVLLGVWSYYEKNHGPASMWLLVAVPLGSLGILIAINERERWSPRVVRSIPKNALLRAGAFLLYSGAAGGLLFAGLLLGLTFLGLQAWERSFPTWNSVRDLQDIGEVMLLIALYTVAYSLTAVLVRHYVLAGRIPSTRTWVIVLLLVGIGSALPSLLVFLFSRDSWAHEEDAGWYVTNPFAALMAWRDRSQYFTAVAIWAGVATTLCMPWIVTQLMRFRPPVRKAVKAQPV